MGGGSGPWAVVVSTALRPPAARAGPFSYRDCLGPAAGYGAKKIFLRKTKNLIHFKIVLCRKPRTSFHSQSSFDARIKPRPSPRQRG
jgi:hypothetical protein